MSLPNFFILIIFLKNILGSIVMHYILQLAITLPPDLDEEKYEVAEEKLICKPSGYFTSLTQAIQFCEFVVNCQGLHDQYCDGSSISTCTELNPPKNPDSPQNGCTFKKKGEFFRLRSEDKID